jgi:hypothetical protein
LAFGVYSPGIFDPKTGLLTSEAIQIDGHLRGDGARQDVCGQSSGASVCRIDKEGASEELQAALAILVAKAAQRGKVRQVEGTAFILASEVFAIRDGRGQTVFQILDDGCNCYKSHAVIRAHDGFTRSALRGPRDDLLKQLNQTIMRNDESKQGVVRGLC